MSNVAQKRTGKAEGISVPARLSDTDVISLIQSKNIDREYLRLIKQLAPISDNMISNWLNINVKTLRNYRKNEIALKDNIKEQLILLVSLFKHGNEVFHSKEAFLEWLNEENFYFDGKAPINFLNTVSGIRFVDDRLTGMEYGDNV